MHYKFSSQKPHSHFIDIELTIDNLPSEQTIVQLPLWRPGRYELGNFAKNIRRFKVFDKFGAELNFHKTDKSTWLIENGNHTSIVIDYSYYANQPDAGACFSNDDLLYVNPVHCCLCRADTVHQEHTVELNIPVGWQVATSLTQSSQHVYYASSFDELVDSPFMASPALQHYQYTSQHCVFHLHIQGNYNPDVEKLITDFKAFTDLQLNVMQNFPCSNYHFLILALPYKFYHGVEHLKSTVLAIGPASKLNEKEFYDDLIGVASHELFHVWNVKTIRPAEMMPYDFAKENYARTGYVYEGVTTYYGDLFLRRCNYFKDGDYFEEINKRLMKHVNNQGRFNLSVADSSFDTWLDGYVPGVPGRKVSIYDEGSLIALMLDILIMHMTACTKSMDDVMRALYTDFGKHKTGYSDSDFINACNTICGKDLKSFFNETAYKATDYTNLLNHILNHAGCYLKITPSDKLHETDFGIRIKIENPKILIADVIADSPADHAGAAINDELLYLNGEKIEIGNDESEPETNFDYLLSKHENQEMELQITSFYKTKTIILSAGSQTYFQNYAIAKSDQLNEKQKTVFDFWLSGRVAM